MVTCVLLAVILFCATFPAFQQQDLDPLAPPYTVHVGFIYMSDEKKGDLYKKIVDQAIEAILDEKHVLLPWTRIRVLYGKIGNSPRAAVEKVCELVERGVSTIIFPGPSPLVASVADIANSFNIPVIAPTATNPFLRDPTHRPFLLQMPPTDDNQSRAIAAILNKYGWIYFSILTSYDSYGINGVLKLQQIASSKSWKILNTQHFVIPKDITDLDVSRELKVIKNSEARIIVLNCPADAARIVLQQAQDKARGFSLVGDGYMWIVTDGVVGDQELFTGMKSIPEWNGIIGTLPSSKNGKIYNKFYNTFVQNYQSESKKLDMIPRAAMIYDSILIFGHALNNFFSEGNNLFEKGIPCVQHTSCSSEPDYGEEEKVSRRNDTWPFGELLFKFITQVKLDGASRNYTFSETGNSLNLIYSIMNFKKDVGFVEVARFDSSPENNELKIDMSPVETVIFMGENGTNKPEHRPITLNGRKLRLGINMESPFITEKTIECDNWNCTYTLTEGSVTHTNACNVIHRHILLTSECYRTNHTNICVVPRNDKPTEVITGIGYDCKECFNRVACQRCEFDPDYDSEEPTPVQLQEGENRKCKPCSNNTCYSGYCIELVKNIAKELNFTFEFYKSRDGNWGGYDEDNGTWDGLVKDLLDGYIDIATVHFSINAKRQKVIDFSAPFMQVGLTVVVKAEVDSSNEFFFFTPFSTEVWYCVMLSAFLITIFVCVFNKISPYGLYGRKMHALMTCPCKQCKETRRQAKNGQKSLMRYQEYPCLVEEVENYGEDRLEALSFHGSQLLIDSSILKQGVVFGASQCVSGRTLLTCWWYIIIVFFSLYVANLAAMLTVTRMKVGIKRVEDLLNQDKLEWGTVSSTSPEILLRGSTKDEYTKLAENLKNVDNATHGFDKVKEGKYAFIYESALLEYKVQQTCDLVIAGEKFSKFGFAFGFPPNSPYKAMFSNVILSKREKNELDEQWEKIKGDPKKCEKLEKESQSTSRLDMKNLSGLFSVMILGILLSILFLFAEYSLACFEDVYGNEFPEDSERPKNLNQAFRRRLKLTWLDIKNHWFVLETFRKLEPPSEEEMLHYMEYDMDDINIKECPITPPPPPFLKRRGSAVSFSISSK